MEVCEQGEYDEQAPQFVNEEVVEEVDDVLIRLGLALERLHQPFHVLNVKQFAETKHTGHPQQLGGGAAPRRHKYLKRKYRYEVDEEPAL